MRAFHNDPAIKAEYLARVRAHREADELVKGQYWVNGRGCAVGCTIHGSDHRAHEPELGIPAALAYLEDAIFEGLPLVEALAWPEAFLNAILVGADLSRVADRFLLWLLEAEVLPNAGDSAPIVERVAALYRRRLTGDEPSVQEWRTAAWAAWNGDETMADAESWATWAAAQAAARGAWATDVMIAPAWGSEAASPEGVAGAAGAAARMVALDAARADSYPRQSRELLRLLAEAPVTEDVQ